MSTFAAMAILLHPSTIIMADRFGGNWNTVDLDSAWVVWDSLTPVADLTPFQKGCGS
jgi:hypothetical protein